MVSCKFLKYLFYICEMCHWYSDKDCIESIDYFGYYGHFNDVNSPNPWACYIFHLFVSSLIAFFSVVQFSEYRSFTSSVRFILTYFIFQQMVLGDLDRYMQKNEAQISTYTIHKNKLKMDKRLKCKSRHHKSPRGEHRQKNLRYFMQQYFHRYIPQRTTGKHKTHGLNPTLHLVLSSLAPCFYPAAVLSSLPLVKE